MLVPGRKLLPPGALALLATILCCWSVAGRAQERAPGCAPVARVVSVQGTLQLQRAGQGAVSSVRKIGAYLCENDLLHAEAGSRAALFINAETLVRLDQNSTVRISHTASETVVEFIKDTAPITRTLLAPDQCGAGYFITRFPRRFRVITPFANAVVEGTEFSVALRCESTDIAVFEGKVRAELPMGAARPIALTSGQTLSVGEGQPPAIKLLVKPTDAVQWVLYYPPLSEAEADRGIDQPCDAGASTEKSRCLSARAERRLRTGRVQEARADIDEALKLSRDNADGQALSSVISVAQNEKVGALDSAQRATQLELSNPRTWIALSYAQQASFKLEDALNSAEHAVTLAPRSALAQARVAELLMSLGKIRSAERAATTAVEANPNESRAHTILGFVHLAQIDTKRARSDFEAGIERDSTDPLPRLGLGLAIIRDGNLKAGREEIEIAVALDPTNSLIRSYVGKAYYEENTKERDRLAASQFGLAKELDPKDPTPWFYDATLKQTQNRPVEALLDLQKSIELNDNRAPFRSRLLLDEDRASKGSRLAEIYHDLGFDQLAIVEAAKALAIDPGNSSAHLFLADAYTQYPRSQIARESEYLQFQLRQPLSVTPLSPLRSETNPFSASIPISGILRSLGPARTPLNDFTSLFDRQGVSFFFDGLISEQRTTSEQFVVSALGDRLALQAGGGRFGTDGFSDNRDFTQSAYDLSVQAQLSSQLSVQAEQRGMRTERGDAFFAFDPNAQVPFRLHEVGQTTRLGLRYRIDEKSDILLSAAKQTYDFEFDNGAQLSSDTDIAEAQYMRSGANWTMVAGFGHVDGERGNLGADPLPGTYYSSAYLYSFFRNSSATLEVQLGASLDSFSQGDLTYGLVSPKFGVIWLPIPDTAVRAGIFRAAKPAFVVGHTIEPTQVAGFNQFFDDVDGSNWWRYGIGVDQLLPHGVRVGAEYTERNIETPKLIDIFTWRERQTRLYLYWPIKHLADRNLHNWSAAVTLEYQNELLQRPQEDTGFEGIVSLRSQYLPVSFALFPGHGISAQLRATYVTQNGRLQQDFGTTAFPVESHFWVTDLAFGYRIGTVRGAQLYIGVTNLFDRRFSYVDPAAASPLYARERMGYARLALQF